MTNKNIRVAFLGLRGFPGVQGGVETHAEHLCPILVGLGCDVEVIARAPYQAEAHKQSWNGVRFKTIWAPKSRMLEAVLHSFLGVLYAGFVSRPDILHIQAIGPALTVPFARLLGLRVVVTHHGPDYDRQKWGTFAKWMIRLGESFGMRLAHGRIVISDVIREIVQRNHNRSSTLIPNGVLLPDLPSTSCILKKFGLLPGKYVLLVSRLVPEKRHLDLIAAFSQAGLSDWKLVLVGASDHPDPYVRELLDASALNPNVVCTGFQNGLALRELYTHAGMFVLPSSHEGLPIAMLEALSYGLPVIASDIPANLEVGLPKHHYFALGNVPELAERLTRFAAMPLSTSDKLTRREWVSTRYNWDDIAQKTLDVYKQVISA
jgi:glycosyltransferase involved in cell wall biosynthesis